jgi:iodotyrosine deiodinase
VGEYRPVPLEWSRLEPEEAIARSRTFLELMRRRRSVRMFSPEPVPFELVRTAIEVAGTAPSGAHQQPWTFVVIAEEGLKQRIRAAAERAEREFYDHRASPEWLDALRPLGTDFVKEHITDAPYVIAVFEQAFAGDGEPRRKHYYAKESVGIAVGFLLAALHASGLVALTHTPAPMTFLGHVLGRPANERAFCLVPIGYPAEDAVVPDLRRKPLDEIAVFL